MTIPESASPTISGQCASRIFLCAHSCFHVMAMRIVPAMTQRPKASSKGDNVAAKLLATIIFQLQKKIAIKAKNIPSAAP